MNRSPSKWATCTVAGGSTYQPKEATDAEVAEFLAGQGTPGTEIRIPETSGGQYVVCRNTDGRILFSGEGCLQEKNGWTEVFRGSYSECLDEARRMKV